MDVFLCRRCGYEYGFNDFMFVIVVDILKGNISLIRFVKLFVVIVNRVLYNFC